MQPVTQDEIHRLYARLPEIRCQKKCQDYCTNIVVTTVEKGIILSAIVPLLGKEVMDIPPMGSDPCPFLTHIGECGIYDVRPAICRLWGLVKKMRCPHGCVPDRWVSDKESRRLLHRLLQVSGGDISVLGQ